ncbi:MAG: hypothetical protein A2Z73_00395 [Deltaproteobacteria bacterium RBG_13_60_28]|nr:MAG: hypothetical protein A2Z73_00395 [Deltaproteobacteria bacterium RBG_13_60_28]
MRVFTKTSVILLAVIFYSMSLPSGVHADLIYASGSPDSYGGSTINATNITLGNFTLAAHATINKVVFWGIDMGQVGGDIYWFFYTDTNVSSLIPEASGVATLAGIFDHHWGDGSPSYRYEFPVTPVNLAAGDFWLGLKLKKDTEDYLNISWETTNRSTSHAFELYGTASSVPLPGAVWLLGSGLLSLVGLRRLKKS